MPPYVENDLVFHEADTFEYNPFDRYCAAEIEVANMDDQGNNRLIKVANDWSASIVRDGSLPSTGFEINTAPATGDSFTTQINALCDTMKANKALVENSCGLHVHIDARDFSAADIAKYAALWRKIENTMFSLVPTYRNSHYSKVLGNRLEMPLLMLNARNSTSRLADKVYASGAGTRLEDYRHRSKPCERYYAVNLHSWFHRGTVEIRMHHGTIDAKKILNWSILNMSILESSRNLTASELNNPEFLKSDEDKLAFIVAVSPPHIREWIIDTYNFFTQKDGEFIFQATKRHECLERSEPQFNA